MSSRSKPNDFKKGDFVRLNNRGLQKCTTDPAFWKYKNVPINGIFKVLNERGSLSSAYIREYNPITKLESNYSFVKGIYLEKVYLDIPSDEEIKTLLRDIINTIKLKPEYFGKYKKLLEENQAQVVLPIPETIKAEASF